MFPIKNFMRASINFGILITILFVLFPGYTWGGGSTGSNFLKIGVGGRNIGMGEVGAAVSNDVNSIVWNPAGLSQIKGPELSFMHNEWLQSINYDYLGYAHPLNRNNGVIGVSLYSVYMDKIDGYDENDNPSGGVKASDFAGTLSYARELKNWSSKQIILSGGINLKFIQEKLDDESANAYAGDIGLLCRLPLSFFYALNTDSVSGDSSQPTVGIGAVVQNVGSGIKFLEDRAPLPTNYKFGLSLNALKNSLVAGLDYNIPRQENPRINMGVEYTCWDIVSVRSGYVFGLDVGEGLRIGMGLKFKIFQLDYAYSPYGDLGNSHRFNFKIKFLGNHI